MCRHRIALLFLVMLFLPTAPLTAVEPSKPRGWLDPLRYRDGLKQAAAGAKKWEAVEMLTAILGGSQMGPGEGWFHDGQSRYTWPWLAQRHGIDPKGSISRQRFDGPADVFARLDLNKDGVLKAEDFDWSYRAVSLRQGGPPSFWFSMYDRNSNGRISREEWDALFEKASKGKGYLTAQDLREAFPLSPPPRPPGPPPKNEGPSTPTLLLGVFNGELGSVFEGPRVGQHGPDFTLKKADGRGEITLSKYHANKPVVLIFGSFT